MQTFLSGILAGALIGLGGIANITTDIPIVGALLFAVGLYAVLVLELDLYTGRVPYIVQTKDFVGIGRTLAGNLIGAWGVGWAFRASGLEARDVMSARMPHNALNWLILGFLCGTCIYIGVEAFKRSQAALTVLSVMLFVAAGFEHSIADMFYFTVYGWTWREIWWLALVIVGNALGGIVVHNVRKAASEWLDD